MLGEVLRVCNGYFILKSVYGLLQKVQKHCPFSDTQYTGHPPLTRDLVPQQRTCTLLTLKYGVNLLNAPVSILR